MSARAAVTLSVAACSAAMAATALTGGGDRVVAMAAAPAAAAAAESEAGESVRNDNPRTTAAGFDPEALERGAKALREINASQYAKKVRWISLST